MNSTELLRVSGKLPHLVIVGRPNVGKSTLFNRLVGRRRAIIDSTPGVTRDPISHKIDIAGYECMLSDTAGLGESREYLDRLIAQKNRSLISGADIILLMLDISDLTPEDEHVIEYLRPYAQRTIVLVNKVDNEQRSQMVHEYYRFGFKNLFPISASHNLGIDDLLDELEQRIATMQAQAPEPEIEQAQELEPEIEQAQEPDTGDGGDEEGVLTLLILGQPNTGKSTLANLLSEGEESIVSDIAGTTRDILERTCTHKGVRFHLFDTAGIRRKKKINENLEYYSVNRAISAIPQSEIVLLLVDVEKGLSEQDKKIASQVVKHGRGIIVVMNKWDIGEDIPNRLHAIIDRVRFFFPILSFAPVLPLSATEGTGLEDVLETVFRIRKQLHHRVSTGPLNRKLEQWKTQTPPPSQKGFFWKVKYLVQVSILPTKFILFVNRKTGFPESYAGYIKNRIREEFQIAEIPIHLEIRDSRRD